MSYHDKLESLLDIAEQAVNGVDFDNRKVAFLGLSILKDMVIDCRQTQASMLDEIGAEYTAAFIVSDVARDKVEDLAQKWGMTVNQAIEYIISDF